jgi:hypothetical protein
MPNVVSLSVRKVKFMQRVLPQVICVVSEIFPQFRRQIKAQLFIRSGLM